jgi:4-hydroxybenzoate polyprenyltransferase
MIQKIKNFLDMIKFEHTIFALPFAYLGMFLAAEGWPTGRQFLWITVAMVAARTVAMAINRLADRRIDADNPRTAHRPLVAGEIAPTTAWIGAGLAAITLTVAAWQLGPLPLKLLPGALLLLVGYSFTKRFTWLSHFILGLTDGLAPMGAWVAVRGSLFTPADLPAWLLLSIVTLWIGGFDLIYACQDVAFDRRARLHAIPARFGIAAALRLSALSHILAVLLLAGLGRWLDLGWPYWAGIGITTGLFVYEHTLVHPDDLSKINVAFFNLNAMISITLLTGVWAALWI